MSNESFQRQFSVLQKPSKATSDRPAPVQTERSNKQLEVVVGTRTAVIQSCLASVLKVSRFFPTGEQLSYTRNLSQFR